MEVVRIRRVGNSNVLSVPRRIAARGFDVGQPVALEVQENGDLLIRRLTSDEEVIQAAGAALAEKYRGALDRLAAHEPDETVLAPRSRCKLVKLIKGITYLEVGDGGR